MDSSQDPSPELMELLELKRHEAASPEQLDRVSARIMARLESERDLRRPGFWSAVRAVALPEFSPTLACAYGVALIALVLVGIEISQMGDQGDGNERAPSIAVSGPPAPAPGPADAAGRMASPWAAPSNTVAAPDPLPAGRPLLPPEGKIQRANYQP